MPGLANERLGWLLILTGLCTAVGLDPWSLGERDPSALLASTRMAARHAQAVVLAMGFLQITAAMLLREETLARRPRCIASPVLAVGTLLYAAGYAGLIWCPGSAWLISFGAAVNLYGFGLLGWIAWRAPVAIEVRAVLAIFLLGMALDLVTGLCAIDAGHLLLIHLGPEDGVRQRMLRLARVAATALSLLVLLYRNRAIPRAVYLGNRWARLGLLMGTVGIPTVLAAAALVLVDLKYLLPIPALAMTGGVTLALAQSRRIAPPLEQWGWLLVAVSMTIGLLIGLYAFDGPLPTPNFVGEYNHFVRRLMRLGHAYSIVLGLLAILLARQGAARPAGVLLVVASSVTLVGIMALTLLPEGSVVLAPGPALVVVALAAGVDWNALRFSGPPSA